MKQEIEKAVCAEWNNYSKDIYNSKNFSILFFNCWKSFFTSKKIFHIIKITYKYISTIFDIEIIVFNFGFRILYVFEKHYEKLQEEIMNKIYQEKKIIELKKQGHTTIQRPLIETKEYIYKITSPFNFNKDSHIQHGSSKYFEEIPDWSKNNSRIVIEKELYDKNKKYE